MQFRYAHAAHPDWAVATEECLLSLSAQTAAAGYVREPNLGFVYLTDSLSRHVDDILSTLKARTGVSSWVGASGTGICATGTEYIDEPALAVMLGQFAPGSFNVFSGMQRPPALDTRNERGQNTAWTALVHSDTSTFDLPLMLQDMAGKVVSGYLFGGVANGRHRPVQVADQVLGGGISGVVFAQDVGIVSRLTQGCFPLPGAKRHRVTEGGAQALIRLDQKRAFDVLLTETGLARSTALSQAQAHGDGHAIDGQTRHALHALARQGLFVGIESHAQHSEGRARSARAGMEYTVRHIVALDPGSGAVQIAGTVHEGQHVVFCTCSEPAARKDLIRVCSELRETAADKGTIQGAVYYSCLGRGGHLFGEQGAELRLMQEQLGSIPLVGLYANGEISGSELYGYSGVLALFLAPRPYIT